jgi:endo-1,4-beta-xylanase
MKTIWMLLLGALLTIILLSGCDRQSTEAPSTSLSPAVAPSPEPAPEFTPTPSPPTSVPEPTTTPPVLMPEPAPVTPELSPTTPVPAPTTPAPEKSFTLRELANSLGLDFGTAIMPMGMDDTLYLKTLSEQFNLVVPDYGMYMANIQPQQGVWNFSEMDKIVYYAKANKLKVRGHTLVWGQHYEDIGTIGKDWTPTPAWVHNGKFSREDMIKIMDDHIITVMNRYRDQVDEWVVVNESASWEGGGGFANNIWKAKIGEDYVELAFKKARELDPDAILILNEFGGDYIDQTTFGREDNIYNHVKKLVQRKVPIDAVGLEFHLTIPPEPWETEPTLNKMVANFDRYGELGLEVYVTELDVRVKEPVTREKLDAQARIYAMVMEAVLLSEACKSISVWGYSDAYSWITTFNTFPGYTDGCMFDRSINPKRAYDTVIDVLRSYQANAG